jgi:hypothetical protein
MPKEPETPRMWVSALFGCSSSTETSTRRRGRMTSVATKLGMTPELAVEHSPPPHAALLTDGWRPSVVVQSLWALA